MESALCKSENNRNAGMLCNGSTKESSPEICWFGSPFVLISLTEEISM